MRGAARTTITDAPWFNLERLVGAALSDAPGALKIDYTGGFTVVDPTVGGAEADLTSEDANMSDDAPEDLKMVCIAQCIFLWDKMRSGSIGIEDFEDGEPMTTQGMLAPEALELATKHAHFETEGEARKRYGNTTEVRM